MTPVAEFAHGIADVNGAQLYYEIGGNGPALVLIHARIADSRMWDDTLQALAQQYTVLRYDLRGHGRSLMPSGSFSHCADLAGLLQFCAISRASLIGCSMGGEIAIDFALEYPERVNALIAVACAPTGYKWSSDLDPLWVAIFTALEQGDFAGAVERELQLWVDGPYRKAEQVNPTVRQRIGEMDMANWQALADYRSRAQPLPAVQPPAYVRLAMIDAPTLILVGDADVPDIRASADLLMSTIPVAEKEIIAGAGHMLPMEQPAHFTQRVHQFLHKYV